jgi:hypothetical protein
MLDWTISLFTCSMHGTILYHFLKDSHLYHHVLQNNKGMHFLFTTIEKIYNL